MSTRFLATLLLLLYACPGFSQDAAQTLFQTYADRLYQIKVVEVVSTRKSSIGSGFLVRPDGLMATNYHVVSEYVTQPDKYRMEYVASNGETGPLTVENIDVINDLALVKADFADRPVLQLSQSSPGNGEPIYAMGNPLDLGAAVVPGTYNGYTAHSYYQRIHFTGSLNPGMSGGPTLNQQGNVIGINVATSGNQVSFLVAVDKLHALLARHTAQQQAVTDFKQLINDQLHANQRQVMDTIMAADWTTTTLGDSTVLKEVAPFLPCWGNSNSRDEERTYDRTSIFCDSKENIFIESNFQVGDIEIQYEWTTNKTLLPVQFYSLLQATYGNARPANKAGKQDVTNFTCHEGFIGKPDMRATLCARAYKDYPNLYDVLFIAVTVDHSDRALLSHFTLSGFEKQQALRFAQRFIESIQWN